MKSKQAYTYNEHDRNQVHEVLRKQKRKKQKRRQKFAMLIIIVVLVLGFFISDYSKIQSIKVSGNTRLSTKEVLKLIPIKEHQTITLFASVNKVEAKLKSFTYVKDVSVSKDLFGNVKIKITENEPIAYSTIENKLYIVDETGKVSIDTDNRLSSYVQRYPKINNFNNEELLKKFAAQFYKIPSQVQNQISDINYAPLAADETRCEFIMDDDKVFYVRIEDMAKKLEKNNYADFIKQFPDCKYFNLLGKHCYAWK